MHLYIFNDKKLPLKHIKNCIPYILFVPMVSNYNKYRDCLRFSVLHILLTKFNREFIFVMKPESMPRKLYNLYSEIKNLIFFLDHSKLLLSQENVLYYSSHKNLKNKIRKIHIIPSIQNYLTHIKQHNRIKNIPFIFPYLLQLR